jgi:crotonobetainyl-CoA:carnitine CoA-transferase CaiB-like acyl-CoA transferase
VGLEGYRGIPGIERRTRRAELVKRLQDVFSSRPRDEWVKLLENADVPVFPVRTLAEVTGDPHVEHREMIQEIPLQSGERMKQVSFPIKLSEMDRRIRKPPPELGEHTEEILEDLGYSRTEISKFKEEGVV